MHWGVHMVVNSPDGWKAIIIRFIFGLFSKEAWRGGVVGAAIGFLSGVISAPSIHGYLTPSQILADKDDRIKGLEKEKTDVERDLKSVRADLADKNGKLGSNERENEELKIKLSSSEARIAELQKKYSELLPNQVAKASQTPADPLPTPICNSPINVGQRFLIFDDKFIVITGKRNESGVYDYTVLSNLLGEKEVVLPGEKAAAGFVLDGKYFLFEITRKGDNLFITIRKNGSPSSVCT